MVNQCEPADMVYGFKVSSVGPGRVTGLNSTYEPTNLDLAMKLHYHRVAYLFESKTVELCGLTVARFKETCFTWLAYYYESCGRFRRSEETGRPYIKCNDCGVRFIEAKSSKTVEEWVELNYKDASRLKLLVPSQVLGPDLTFSPPVFIQVTNLKCGGLALGLGFAHVLGDFFSVTEYMNSWAGLLSGYQPKHQPNLFKLKAHEPKSPIHTGPEEPLSLKRADPVGDYWAVASSCKFTTFSILLTSTKLAQLQTKVLGLNEPGPSPYFETLCGVIWQAVAKAKSGPKKPNKVTVIKKDIAVGNGMEIIRNNQVVSVVQVDFEVKDTHPMKLARLIGDQAVDERARISKMVESEPESSDFVVYGSNLTFVNLEGANCYGFVMKGHQPCLVNYFVDGVGDEGVVFLLPGPTNGKEGRSVTMILPESEMSDVLKHLATEWSICS